MKDVENRNRMYGEACLVDYKRGAGKYHVAVGNLPCAAQVDHERPCCDYPQDLALNAEHPRGAVVDDDHHAKYWVYSDTGQLVQSPIGTWVAEILVGKEHHCWKREGVDSPYRGNMFLCADIHNKIQTVSATPRKFCPLDVVCLRSVRLFAVETLFEVLVELHVDDDEALQEIMPWMLMEE
jgi:hypothetical protein